MRHNLHYYYGCSFCAVGVSVAVSMHGGRGPRHLFTGSKLLAILYWIHKVNSSVVPMCVPMQASPSV